MATHKSVLNESRQIERAVSLIEMGARLQVLESETELSYERLLRLYKEVAGKSPSKGQLPFSTDWFLTWQPNIHASLFHNIYTYLTKTSALEGIDALIKAYQLYTEQVGACGLEPQLSITRAWRLVRFMENKMLAMTPCSQVRRPFRDRALRERAPFRLRPVRAAGARRQGRGRRRHPAAMSYARLRRDSDAQRPDKGPSNGPLFIDRPDPLAGPNRRLLKTRHRAMFVIIGYLVALGCIFGGYIIHGGNIGVVLHALPIELMVIGGGAIGAFVVNNQPKVLKATLKMLPTRLQGLQVHQGALHGADGAALRHPAEGAQGRPDVDREGRRGAARLADLPEVPDGRQATTTWSSSPPTTCA